MHLLRHGVQVVAAYSNSIRAPIFDARVEDEVDAIRHQQQSQLLLSERLLGAFGIMTLPSLRALPLECFSTSHMAPNYLELMMLVTVLPLVCCLALLLLYATHMELIHCSERYRSYSNSNNNSSRSRIDHRRRHQRRHDAAVEDMRMRCTTRRYGAMVCLAASWAIGGIAEAVVAVLGGCVDADPEDRVRGSHRVLW